MDPSNVSVQLDTLIKAARLSARRSKSRSGGLITKLLDARRSNHGFATT